MTTSLLAGVGVGVGVACAACLVWFFGFDVPWAIAIAVAVTAVGGVLAMLSFDDPAAWDAPPRETPRATRLTIGMLEQSLAACDRLAAPALLRRVYRLTNAERDDRLARATVVRQLRALLLAALHDHGLDATAPPQDIAALVGPDALAVVSLHDTTVTSATIARCLDALEHLVLPTPPRS